MVEKTIKIAGLKEFQEMANWDVLVQPEMELARDTITQRIQRGGKGLGAQRNTLTVAPEPLGATVTTTLNYPRVKGTTWGRYFERTIPMVANRAIAKAISRMEARWAISGRGGFG